MNSFRKTTVFIYFILLETLNKIEKWFQIASDLCVIPKSLDILNTC